MFTERLISLISIDLTVATDWSLGGHRTGQIVSETAYHVTNL